MKYYNSSNTDEFIQKAKIIHNNKYDYTLVDYKNAFIKIKILCKIHGVFEQTPNNHLRNHGCPKCRNDFIGNAKRKNVKTFVTESNKIYKNKYDYSKVEYKNNRKQVIIICPIHGEFHQNPDSHLKGCGCFKCGVDVRTKKLRDTLPEFIEKAKVKHNNKYDYSEIHEYTNNHTKVKIKCPIHGIFEQVPNSHLAGNGCPCCVHSECEIKIEKWLVENNIDFNKQKKFDGCKHIQRLPFDFYLSKYNLCIEYDGEQHYKGWRGHIESLNGIKKRDAIKTKWCKDNKVNLLRIPYWKKKNLIEIIKRRIDKLDSQCKL